MMFWFLFLVAIGYALYTEAGPLKIIAVVLLFPVIWFVATLIFFGTIVGIGAAILIYSGVV